MVDFYQNGIITTLHNLNNRPVEELEKERGKLVPSFTHYLDLPMLFLIIALGTIKPNTWEMFFYGSAIAIGLALFFTILIPRIYPWGTEFSQEN